MYYKLFKLSWTINKPAKIIFFVDWLVGFSKLFYLISRGSLNHLMFNNLFSNNTSKFKKNQK